jgi:hypothetical protein
LSAPYRSTNKHWLEQAMKDKNAKKEYICKEGCDSIGSCRKKLTVQLINLKQQLRKGLPTLRYYSTTKAYTTQKLQS